MLNVLAKLCHENSKAKGFWEGKFNFGEKIALMHSELSEALEAERSGNPRSKHIKGFSVIEEEFADVIIRILDCADAWGLDMDEAVKAKMIYNEERSYKHGKEF